MSDQVAHQHVHHVLIETQHDYTDDQYSNDWLIAPTDSADYAPHIKSEEDLWFAE